MGPNPFAPLFVWEPWGSKGVSHDNCYDYAMGSYSSVRKNHSVPGNRCGEVDSSNFTRCGRIKKDVLDDNKGAVFPCGRTEKARVGCYKVMCFVAPHNDVGNSGGDFHWYKEMSGVEYKTLPRDTIDGLARFFQVNPLVIKTAIAHGTASTSAKSSRGKIADEPDELRVLKKYNDQYYKFPSQRITPGRVLRIPCSLWSHKTGWAGGPKLVDASGKTIKNPLTANRCYHGGFHYDTFCGAFSVLPGMAQTGTNADRLGGR
jgi:hypothetical protein